MDDEKINIQKTEEPGILGYILLIIFIVLFSGLLRGKGAWSALDFVTLIGRFGNIGDLGTFVGTGGTGARGGFMSSFALVPAVMFAMGLVGWAKEYGAMTAGQKLVTPFMRPLLGLPGYTAVTFMASMSSSDAGAMSTRDLYNSGYITDNEKTVFLSYQYAGSGTIINTFVSGAPLLTIIDWPIGAIFLLIFSCKILGANLVRIYLLKNKDKDFSIREEKNYE